MRVMFDLDGCYFNYGDSLHRYMDHAGLGHLWRSGPTPEPFWHFYKDWNMSLGEFIRLNNAAADAGFLFTGPMREGGKEAWDRIANTDVEIIVATDRAFGSTPASSQKNTYHWLEQHDLWWDEVWFTADKPSCNPDMAVDDKVENFEALLEAGVDVYLIDRPWNRHIDAGERRIPDVLAFADIVESKMAMI